MSHRTRTVLSGSLVVAALSISVAASAAPSALPSWRILFKHSCGRKASCSYLNVAASGTANAWAVGGAGGNGAPSSGRPVAARWHNGSWHASPLPRGLAGFLNAVSTDSAHDAWAVAATTGYVVHWNGTRWSVAKRWPEQGQTTELTGVTAFSPRNVWVFGGPGAFPGFGTWHFNGHSWAHITRAPGNGIVQASALSPTNMWAVGSNTAPQDSIVHFTGTWRQVTSKALTGLQFTSIVAVTGKDVWALGTLQTNSFRPYLVHRTASGWTRIKVPFTVDPVSVASDGRGGIWLTAFGASRSFAIHRSAAGRWTRVAIGTHATLLRLTRIPGTSSLWGVGGVQAGSVSDAAVWANGRVR